MKNQPYKHTFVKSFHEYQNGNDRKIEYEITQNETNVHVKILSTSIRSNNNESYTLENLNQEILDDYVNTMTQWLRRDLYGGNHVD